MVKEQLYCIVYKGKPSLAFPAKYTYKRALRIINTDSKYSMQAIPGGKEMELYRLEYNTDGGWQKSKQFPGRYTEIEALRNIGNDKSYRKIMIRAEIPEQETLYTLQMLLANVYVQSIAHPHKYTFAECTEIQEKIVNGIYYTLFPVLKNGENKMSDLEGYKRTQELIKQRKKEIEKLGKKGQFLNITFIKQDGTERQMQCILSKHVKIGKKKEVAEYIPKLSNHPEYITVLDVKEYQEQLKSGSCISNFNAARRSFRQINLLTLKRVAGGGKVYNV